MESLSITIGIILFVWGVAFYMIRLKKEKIQEDKERRLRAFQDELDLGFGSNEDLSPPPVSHNTSKIDTTPPPIKQQPKSPTPPPPKPIEHTTEFKEYLQERYKKLGYTIWKHEQKEFGIDIIAKQAKELLIIRCILSSKKEAYRVTLNDLKAFRMDVNDFIELNPLFGNYEASLLLILSDEIVEEEAKNYIKELQGRDKKIDYKVIPF